MNRIKKLRTKCGLSQAALAEKIKVGQNTIAYWENEKVMMPAVFAVELAKLFNVSTDYLMGREQKEEREYTQGDVIKINGEYYTIWKLGNSAAIIKEDRG